jgi:hypothetical protein
MSCTETCWTQIECPGCRDTIPPRGRSVPLEFNINECCDAVRMNPRMNPCHLWSEHDSTRHYTDPEGWAKHEQSCEQCRGDDD